MTTPAAGKGYETLRQLSAEGVSLWLDGICQDLLTGGSLERLVRDASVTGATSNPYFLVDAVASQTPYREQLTQLAAHGATPEAAVRALIAYDVRWTCDILRPVYERSGCLEGLVSVDLDPRLAYDAAASVAEARVVHRAVNRPNVLVKLPATDAGLTALGDCVAEGVGVHVTTLCSAQRYGEVVDAYFGGLERALEAGRPLSSIASLVSLPTSWLDAEIDARLDALGGAEAASLRGEAALANARLAYRLYEDRLGGDRWRVLAEAGARPQRLMWDSAPPGRTRSHPRYVKELVAWGTANAMPQDMLDAIARSCELHGDTVSGRDTAACQVMRRLERLGVHDSSVTETLVEEALKVRRACWEELLATVGAALRSEGRGA